MHYAIVIINLFFVLMMRRRVINIYIYRLYTCKMCIISRSILANIVAVHSWCTRSAQRAMPGSTLSSGSVQSRGSKASSTEDVSRGPVTIAGILYLRIRRCPCCLFSNSDSNILTDGPFGPDYSLTQVWHRGTAENPTGRFDKVCVIVLMNGGFLVEWGGDVDRFLDERRAKPQLMKEWNAAHAAAVKFLESGPQRLGKKQIKSLEDLLQNTRKNIVEIYNKTEQVGSAGYRAIAEAKYEKKYPGRILEKGLSVKELFLEGAVRRCVLVRKTPEDEWDVSFKDIVGSSLTETHEDGDDLQVSENQAQRKYDRLAQKARLSTDEKERADHEPELNELDAEGEQDDDGLTEYPETAPDDDEGLEDEDDLLKFAVSSMLDTSSNSQGTVAKQQAKPNAKAGTKGSTAPLPSPQKLSGSSLRRSLSNTALSTANTPPAKAPRISSRQLTGIPEGSQSGSEVVVVSKKFANKSVDEILNPHGYALLKNEADKFLASTEGGVLNSWVCGSAEMDAYSVEMQRLKKQGMTLQRQAVSLDIKVKKGRQRPEEVLATLEELRNKIKCLNDALTLFSPSKKTHDATKMEAAKSDMVASGLHVALNFHIMYFKEKGTDLLRFRQVEGFKTHLSTYLQAAMFPSDTEDVAESMQKLIMECTGAGFEQLACCDDASAAVIELASLLLQDDCPLKDDEAIEDVKRLLLALDDGEADSSTRRAAIGVILEQRQKDLYNGILRTT